MVKIQISQIRLIRPIGQIQKNRYKNSKNIPKGYNNNGLGFQPVERDPLHASTPNGVEPIIEVAYSHPYIHNHYIILHIELAILFILALCKKKNPPKCACKTEAWQVCCLHKQRTLQGFSRYCLLFFLFIIQQFSYFSLNLHELTLLFFLFR